MASVTDILRAGASASPPRSAVGPRPPSVVVAGAGGALGSAVLERLLASRRFAPVRVLVTRGLSTAVHGLEPVVVDPLADDEVASPDQRPALGDLAIVVFDRERHANGRELAFARPQPHELAALARWLVARHVRHLLVVLPHSPNGLPAALRSGLANLDEQAVAGLGFEHFVIVRSAQTPVDLRARRWLQRLADGALAQLRFMVPAWHQPVRARKVAQFVAELAAQLPLSAPGTRVAPPELVWQAAQVPDPAPLVTAWLAGREIPLTTMRPPRTRPAHAPRQRGRIPPS